MKNQPKIDWHPFSKQQAGNIQLTFDQVKKATAYIAAVDQTFSQEAQKNALFWIPGFQRLAGLWIQGKNLFRFSLSLENYTLYIVDDKVNVLSSIALSELSYAKLMLWFEEQIGIQGLDASNLEISGLDTSSFAPKSDVSGKELAKYFHNSFVTLRELNYPLSSTSLIVINAENLQQQFTHTVKDSGDPDTNTTLTFGVSLQNMSEAHLYVKSRPFVDIDQFEQTTDWDWVDNEEWTGAKLDTQKLYNEHAESLAMRFYLHSSEILLKALKN